MVDKFPMKGIAYSIGIADDFSWDSAMTEKGFDVYMYDHTIDMVSTSNQHLHFSKSGLIGIYSPEKAFLKTLPMMLEENGHLERYDIVLKIDIEGNEYEVFEHLDEDFLEHFSQIVIEFHALLDFKIKDKIVNATRKLNKNHQLVHVHANNYKGYVSINGMVLPDLLECTYIRKGVCSFQNKECSFPMELDEPNNMALPEILLGNWNAGDKMQVM